MAPEIDSQAAQARLVMAVENVFLRQQQPFVVILEDLHWVDDGLVLLKRLTVLDEFGRNYPIAKSQRNLWWANYHRLDGQLPQAIERWEASVRQAQQMGIRFDQALAHYHWGCALPADSVERTTHLQEAFTIFEAIGAKWYAAESERNGTVKIGPV